MKDLTQCRMEIDEIDQQLIELFEKRMALSKNVVEYKIQNQLEIFQPKREQEVIEKNIKRLTNQELVEYAKCFIQEMMTVSKSYQSDYLPIDLPTDLISNFKDDPIVGYQGIEGAFSQSALENFFGEGTKNIGYKDFEDVYIALEKGEIDYGILPIENSLTGSINDNYDLIRKYNFHIVGETAVNVNQCLMALPGVKLEELKEVYSHPQGLAQSSEYLFKHRFIEQKPYKDTAMAAEYVKNKQDRTKAAIASPLAAKLYGLEIIKENVQNKKNNRTRFMVISKELICPKESNKVSVLFTLPHQVGALDTMLQIIKQSQINIDRIESRPIEGEYWQYYFYLDFDGNLYEERIQRALNKMKANSTSLKILGNYQRA